VGCRKRGNCDVKRDATVPLSPTALGKEVCPAAILFRARNLRRRRRRKKEAGIGLPCTSVSRVHEFRISFASFIVEIAASCTETGGISVADRKVMSARESS
jgi:hypothetical protein